MESIKGDVKGGFDSFIKTQKKVKQPCKVTLVQFDSTESYDLVYQGLDLSEVPPLVLQPRGMTPLLDCIGRTVTKQGERFAALPKASQPDQVILVIITDGEENDSKSWSKEGVFSLLKQQQEEWGWKVTYLGANQDAIRVAEKLGINRGSTMSYHAGPIGASNMFKSLGQQVNSTRLTGQALSYSVADREAAIDQADGFASTPLVKDAQ